VSFQLYEDQQEFISKLRESLKGGVKSVLGVASPAFGKTVIAAHITQQARNRDPNASVWFLVHRKNLLRQTSKSFWQAKIEHGLITSGKMRSTLPIQVGTIGTVHSRMDSLQPPKILFIDEAHQMRGAGASSANAVDFANMIKPALTKGKIKVIASTTWDEYTQSFEKDRALMRRFYRLSIDEPDAATTEQILIGLSPRLEQFHNVLIDTEAGFSMLAKSKLLCEPAPAPFMV